jgi:gliding motility-associated-like protein
VFSNPVASFTLPASVCFPAGAAQFTNTSTNADGSPVTYLWNFGDGSTSTSQNPSHIYASSAAVTVTLTVTNSIGCSSTSSQNFNSFYDKPIADFTVNPTVLCQGTPVQFTDLSTAPNSTIASRLWIFGDGTTSSQTNPTKTYSQPGVYEVKMVVTSAQGCVSDTLRETVTVYLQPVVDAGISFVVPQGTTITFNATANSIVPSFLWTPSIGLSDPTILNPTLIANFDQTYTLTATVAGTCTATDFLTVRIIRPINIPNAFSPNGDGINDTWIIENLTDYPGATVDIFSRDGQKVFTSAGYSKPWDGTMRGKPLPLATYYYVIELRNGYKPLSGSITLIR